MGLNTKIETGTQVNQMRMYRLSGAIAMQMNEVVGTRPWRMVNKRLCDVMFQRVLVRLSNPVYDEAMYAARSG
jgi:hypothetical protein